MQMMKKLLFWVVTGLVALAAVGYYRNTVEQGPQPAIMTVYEGGNEYSILDRGGTFDAGQAAYLVRYYSRNPGNEAVLREERSDLCAVIAKHIDTNEFQRAVIIATEKKGPLFGVLKPREVSHSLSAEEVLSHLSDHSARAVE